MDPIDILDTIQRVDRLLIGGEGRHIFQDCRWYISAIRVAELILKW